jgi:glutamate carboxypeptidase
MPMSSFPMLLACAATLIAGPLAAQQRLSRAEQRIRKAAAEQVGDQISYLQRVVDMPSSTLDLDGVRAVGGVFARSLDSLGFETRWAEMPAEMRRAGHLVAEHRGKRGKARLLLIGHLDTVVDPDGPTFVRRDSVADGIGGSDMKGGDVVVLYALRALAAAGALRDLNVTVVFTGDEEHAGSPLELSRRDLIDAARRSDLALGFESGRPSDLTVARRGAASWRLTTTGTEAHSAGIFRDGTGYGAIYELARILDEFRRELSGIQYLSFNAATVLGGTNLAYDSVAISGTASSKLNIIPRTAVAHGDIRFISAEQHDSAKRRMSEIVARHLPGTGATIFFEDEYPAMSPTPGNHRVLAVYDTLSRALGYDEVVAFDPGRRGAGDISFVAPHVDGVDGLGSMGGGAHTPEEYVELTTLEMQTARAAVFLHRLGSRPASDFARRNP